MVDVFKYECVRGEQDIEQAVHDGDVDTHGCYDGGEKEHFHGSKESLLPEFLTCEIRSKAGFVGGVPCFFAQPGGFALEEDDGVGLAEYEEGEDCY